MLETYECPNTIHYTRVLEFLDSIEGVGSGALEYFSKLIECGLFCKEMHTPTKTVPKEIFFIKLSHHVDKFVEDTYEPCYGYNSVKLKSMATRLRFHMTRSLYTHLSDFDKIQLGCYRISVVDSDKNEIASMDSADLSLFINSFHNGMNYIDAIALLGKMRRYIYSDEYLKEYDKGLTRLMTWLSDVSAEIDANNIYNTTISISLCDTIECC